MPVTYAYPASQRARGTAIRTVYENLGSSEPEYRPVRIPVLGLGGASSTYSTTKRQVYSAAEVGTLYGFDSQLYQVMESLFPRNGDGVGNIPVIVHPLAQPTSGGVAAAGSITPSGTQTVQQSYWIKISNRLSLEIVMAIGDTVADFITAGIAAINGVLGMPGTATNGTTTLDFEVGWEGASGNDVHIEVVSPDDADMSFAITQPTGGAGTVSITDALDQIGNSWDSHVLNCLEYSNTTLLSEYSTYGEGRRQPTVHKPLLVFSGSNASHATVTAITDARPTDRTNVILTEPGSNDLPCVIAADQLRRIAKRANENPAYDYCMMDCPRLTPGPDSSQWNDAQRQSAYLAGCSSTVVVDGMVYISDVVTMYHPTGEDPPAYNKAVNNEKIATVIYNIDREFGGNRWSGRPLVPDGQVVTNPEARKPKAAKAAVDGILEALAKDAIISDLDFAIANSSASISTTNPDRLDVKVVFKVSGNANVISIDLAFSNYFGVAA
jgi:phage tail sheath gpL-like